MSILFRRTYKKAVMLLVIIMLILPIEIKAATYQEQLDAGFIEISGSGETQTLTLRKNQTYYIGIRGARGGSSGLYYIWDYEEGDWYYDYGIRDSGYNGIIKYYEIKVGSSDVRIDIYLGNKGLDGESGEPSRSSSGRLRLGGQGGRGGLGIGNGLKGGDVVRSPRGYRFDYPATAGGGGGGGGASIIRFNANNNQILGANGGIGGDGRSYVRNYEPGLIYYCVHRDSALGGAGGTITNSSNITGITFKEISSAEANMQGIKDIESSGIKIAKPFVPGEGKIKFEEIQDGKFVILPDKDGNLVILQKVEKYYLRRYSGNNSSWTQFPEYIQGHKQLPTSDATMMRPKDGLEFIGGDGTLEKPFYPLPAGVSNKGGGSDIDYTQMYEKIALGLVYLGEKQEQAAEAMLQQMEQTKEQTMVLERQTQSVIDSNKAQNKPIIKYFGLSNGASISNTKNISFALIVEDNKYAEDELTIEVSEIGQNWISKTLNNGMFGHTFSSSGHKTFRARVTNSDGSYTVETITLFIN